MDCIKHFLELEIAGFGCSPLLSSRILSDFKLVMHSGILSIKLLGNLITSKDLSKQR